VIERHQDYVLRSIVVGANATANFVIPLDTDAPFALRLLVSSNFGADAAWQFTITGLDDRKYVGGLPLAAADSLLNPYGGTDQQGGTTFFPVYPQITFPAQLTIQVSITDLSGNGISNGVLIFRGTKLYPEGAVFGPQYPPKFAELNFRYGFQFAVPQGTSSIPSVLASQPLDIQSDADFVVRMASCYVQPGADGFTVGQNDVILRDQYGKPYSNDWVPTETLFPIALGENALGSGGVCNFSVPDVTIFPEIYLVRNTQLLLDIRRTGGTKSNTMNFVLHGSKVYPLG
jgi:hypothetical protein